MGPLNPVDHLAERVDLILGEVKDPADVAQDLLGPQAAEGDDLGNSFVTVVVVEVV